MSRTKNGDLPSSEESIRAGFLFAKETVGLQRLVPLYHASGKRRPVPNPDEPEAYPENLAGGLACDLSAREAVVDCECELAAIMFQVVCDAAGFPLGTAYASPDGTGGAAGNRHFIYKTTGDTNNAVGFQVHIPASFQDVISKPLVVEILGQAHQVTIPPSRHRDGDNPEKWGRYVWTDRKEAPRVSYRGSPKKIGLLDVGRWTAAGVQITLCWPRGPRAGQNRHNIALATAGVLAKAGVPRAVGESLIGLAAETVGDPKADERKRDLESTYDKFEAGQTALTAGNALRAALTAAGLDKDDADRCVDALNRVLDPKGEKAAAGANQEDGSTANLLVQLTEQTCELFRDQDNRPFVTVKDSNIHWRTNSLAFANWLRKQYRLRTGDVVGSEAIYTAVGTIDALCEDAAQYDVFIRTAWLNGNVYLDLGQTGGRVVEVSGEGWRILDTSPPVRFVRPQSMKSLPEPKRGGSLNELRAIVNCTDGGFILLLAWLMAVLAGRRPFPVLIFRGPQDSAKTTATASVKALVDPALPEHRGPPDSVRDLFIAASNCAVLAFDNFSEVSPEMSDALCRLSSGGAYSTRSLYTNDEECVFQLARPVVINGITDLVTRPDLLDRSIIVNLAPILDEQRRTDAKIENDLNRLRPLILGGLLDRLVVGLRNLPNIKLTKLPRMADFVMLAVAAEGDEGKFLEEYARNRSDGKSTALDYCSYGEALFRLVEEGQGTWSGTATALLDRLRGAVSQTVASSLPKNAQALAMDLNRMQATFAAFDLIINYGRDGSKKNQKIITINKRAFCTPPPERRADASDAFSGNSDGAENKGTQSEKSSPSDASDASVAFSENSGSEKETSPTHESGGNHAPADDFAPRRRPRLRDPRPAASSAPSSRQRASDASDPTGNDILSPQMSRCNSRQKDIDIDLDLEDGDEEMIVEPMSDDDGMVANDLVQSAVDWLRQAGTRCTPEEFSDECLATISDARLAFEALVSCGLASRHGRHYEALPSQEGHT